MPFADEKGILIKDPFGACPVVTTTVPGVSLNDLARKSIAWLETSRRPALTLSAGGIMVDVRKGMSSDDIRTAFGDAANTRRPGDRSGMTVQDKSSEPEDVWDIGAFLKQRPY
ncbi:MAG: hypothetical protein H6862_02570 [Rhodospirillales bacterium]|nr:hypothetical protein [Rhodospirillales bacterium]